jgi:hypothetical protein
VRTGVLSAIILAGALGGCAKPTSAVYLSPWDGEATQWEVPPSRMVSESDGGPGAPGGPGIGGGFGGWTTVCTKSDQPNCCYDGKMGRPTGIPNCGWQGLLPNESTTLVAGYKGDDKVTLPAGLTLTSVSPGKFTTYDECVHAPLGFVLSGAGMKEGHLVGDVYHYMIKKDGSWRGAGNGGTIGLVAGRDPQGSGGDGGPASPNYTLSDGLCKPLMEDPSYTASVVFMDQIDFTIDGVDYNTDFRRNPNGVVTGYYVVIQKGF